MKQKRSPYGQFLTLRKYTFIIHFLFYSLRKIGVEKMPNFMADIQL